MIYLHTRKRSTGCICRLLRFCVGEAGQSASQLTCRAKSNCLPESNFSCFLPGLNGHSHVQIRTTARPQRRVACLFAETLMLCCCFFKCTLVVGRMCRRKTSSSLFVHAYLRTFLPRNRKREAYSSPALPRSLKASQACARHENNNLGREYRCSSSSSTTGSNVGRVHAEKPQTTWI